MLSACACLVVTVIETVKDTCIMAWVVRVMSGKCVGMGLVFRSECICSYFRNISHSSQDVESVIMFNFLRYVWF